MDLEDRMSLLLQLASCSLPCLSQVEGVLKSIEKNQVLVDPVGLKTVKEESVRKSLPSHPPFSLTSQFSSWMKCSLLLALPEYKGQKSPLSSQRDM